MKYFFILFLFILVSFCKVSSIEKMIQRQPKAMNRSLLCGYIPSWEIEKVRDCEEKLWTTFDSSLDTKIIYKKFDWKPAQIICQKICSEYQKQDFPNSYQYRVLRQKWKITQNQNVYTFYPIFYRFKTIGDKKFVKPVMTIQKKNLFNYFAFELFVRFKIIDSKKIQIIKIKYHRMIPTSKFFFP